jgi:N-acetylmuramoyl-L-alanine amidase
MVCPLRKRVLSAFLANLLLFSGGFLATELNPVWAKERPATRQESPLGLMGISLSPDGNSLRLETTRPLTEKESHSISVMKFPAPYRLLVEIPNARLASTRTVFPINRNGIDRIELSESQSPFYSSARAIVYVDDNQTLSRLQMQFDNTGLAANGVTRQPTMASEQTETASRQAVPQKTLGKAQPLPPVAKPFPEIAATQPNKAVPLPVPDTQTAPASQTVLAGPVSPDTNIIEDVYFRDNHLVLQGNKGSELRIKNRFTLTAPNRLVLDVDNAVLRSKALMTPITVSSNDIRQIRIGQFDENTVRIVIEGAYPDQYEAVYSGADRSLLAISPYSATSITKLSANTSIGQVESIDLKRENGSTILRLEASAPIVHRFIKRDDRVILDLLNASAHPTNIAVDSSKYPEVAKMRLEPLTEGQPNSKLAITLASPNVKVTPSISPDGKVLELNLIASRDTEAASTALLNSLALGPAGNAPFAARIVVDAGHGGKDLGANRNGVNEKDLNLTLAHMVREALEAKGFKVYMTRSTDVFLPLPEITAITNRIKPDLFISIHHNASVNPALNGIETYYYTPQSIALAKRVHAREINSVAARDGGVKRAMFYVIHHTDVPAILCEVGYISNPQERNELQTYERRIKTARAIADGVVDYLKARVSAQAKPSK